jgi:hypothetical protein
MKQLAVFYIQLPLCRSHQLTSSPSQYPPAAGGRPYLNPSFLYPAALAYQLANGVMNLFSHGRFTM